MMTFLFFRHWLLTYRLASGSPLMMIYLQKTQVDGSKFLFLDCYWERGDGLTLQGGKRIARQTQTDRRGQSEAFSMRTRVGAWVNSPGADCFGLLWTHWRGPMFEQGLCVIPESNGPIRSTILWPNCDVHFQMGRGWLSGSKELGTMHGGWTNSLAWVPRVGDKGKDDLVSRRQLGVNCESTVNQYCQKLQWLPGKAECTANEIALIWSACVATS